MKASLNGALDLKRMARDGMNRVHEQFETPSKEDIDGVLLAIRHVEGRLLDRLEGLDDRVVNLNEKIDKIDQRIAKQEHAIDERVANLNEKIDKVDERTAQRKNAIQRRGQTSKTKAQKPEATTGAKHSLDK
jgi:TolA-binding protein